MSDPIPRGPDGNSQETARETAMRGNPKFGEVGVTTRFGPANKGGGRKPVPEDVKEMACALTPKAIEALGQIVQDKAAPPAARVSAATAILDRAYGKPAQTVNANVVRTIVDVTDAELAAIALSSRDGTPEPQEGEDEPDRVH